MLSSQDGFAPKPLKTYEMFAFRTQGNEEQQFEK